MANIVITTDFTNESRAAYPVAIKLAKSLGAELNLLYISQDVPASAFAASSYAASNCALETPLSYIDPEIHAQISAAQKEELEKESKLFDDLDIKTHFRESQGLPNTEIVKAAEEMKSDFIIMASHGRTGFARMIMGSITECVLRDAPCPVVVVHSKHDNK
jgi:nucleotide-binding universal stress UspA family protein